MASNTATNPDTLIALKVNLEGSNRRFKLPLRDLGANTLPAKLRFLLAIPSSSEVLFERYSDSAAAFITLDSSNASVYKQLSRAAKAKLKLRLKATVIDKEPITPIPATVEDEEPSPVSPVDTQPTMNSILESTPALIPQAAPAASPSEQEILPGSVEKIQRELEDLLISQSRLYSGTACTRSPMADISSSCYGPSRSAATCCIDSEDLLKIPSPDDTEIPAACTVAARDRWFAELASIAQDRQDRHNNSRKSAGVPYTPINIFSVYCNQCGEAIPDEHYHCSTCDDGDFDLCQTCVGNGVLCRGEEHWLIKRFLKGGKVINSTTETIAPKSKAVFSESKTTLIAQEETKSVTATRTCNSCINELSEDNFVTCTTCEDYDLCIDCHMGLEHGHHPKHGFAPAVEDTKLGVVAEALLAPGRNAGHNAVCDGCDKYIYGVRHKCLDCPDWDFCATCLPNSIFIHPGHRFVPIYEALNDIASITRSYSGKAKHHGIYCDGPLCNSLNSTKLYIRGDRYKCAVCHDTDFCASCEASPSNPHNHTHPLIKFKTPVRNVSVTTLGDHEDGKPMPQMGDRRTRSQTSKSTETTQTKSANAATQVQTVADLHPTEPVVVFVENLEVKADKIPEPAQEAKELPAQEELIACFIRDTVADGTLLAPNSVFEQTWYLRNEGKTSWPAGCSVKFVGGDNMCAVDPAHPASVHELVSAAESTTWGSEVTPGQEVGFTVLMRTPNREGSFISYWRLTGPTGDKFGHRLWCDVTVKEPAPAVNEEPKEEAIEPKVESEGSQMIFPKLEKESPSSSMHQEVPVTPPTVDEDEFEEFVEELLNDEETEDGFMTDEEYDILDASDEEFLADQEKAARK